jgi:short-chain fatty acids transporter
MNLLLILGGLIFHGHLKSYLFFAKKGCEKLVSIIVQFPIYGGIMAVIISSGLGEQISRYFVSISTPETFPVFSFLSAGLVNIFVPSGGGQWAVQAPIMIPAAKELGVPLSKAVMAIAWGDAWTNLAQPFWALPLLSIVDMKIKNIVGYCFSALVVSGFVISAVLLIC